MKYIYPQSLNLTQIHGGKRWMTLGRILQPFSIETQASCPLSNKEAKLTSLAQRPGVFIELAD